MIPNCVFLIGSDIWIKQKKYNLVFCRYLTKSNIAVTVLSVVIGPVYSSVRDSVHFWKRAKQWRDVTRLRLSSLPEWTRSHFNLSFFKFSRVALPASWQHNNKEKFEEALCVTLGKMAVDFMRVRGITFDAYACFGCLLHQLISFNISL